MKISKQTLIILVAVAAIAIGAYMYSKKSESSDLDKLPAAPDAFDMDDTAMYQSLVSLFKAKSAKASDLDWINPMVITRHKTNPTKTPNGRASKAESFYSVVSEVNANKKDGRFIMRDGTKGLFPQIMYDEMWAALSPFRIKYSGL